MIDCHFHLWDLKDKYYSWLQPNMTKIYKNFSIENYCTITNNLKINSSIVVQAAENIDESISLLKLASKHEQIKGVIAWVDFENTEVIADLEKLNNYSYLKGIRPILQDMPNCMWINNPAFDKIFKYLIKHDLIFEALIRVRHMNSIAILAKKYPKLKIIINHIAKPEIKSTIDTKEFVSWCNYIKLLAQHNNIYCKISGMITECEEEYSYEVLEPYLNKVLKSFGSNRVLWGSDWPVVNLVAPYETWYCISMKFFNTLDKSVKDNITHNNAISFYKI